MITKEDLADIQEGLLRDASPWEYCNLEEAGKIAYYMSGVVDALAEVRAKIERVNDDK